MYKDIRIYRVIRVTFGSARNDTAFRNNSCRSGEEDMAVRSAPVFGTVQNSVTSTAKPCWGSS